MSILQKKFNCWTAVELRFHKISSCLSTGHWWPRALKGKAQGEALMRGRSLLGTKTLSDTGSGKEPFFICAPPAPAPFGSLAVFQLKRVILFIKLPLES